MRYYKLLFAQCLVFIFFGCGDKSEKKDKILLNEGTTIVNIENQNKVIITGKADDTLALQYVNLINNGYLFGKNYLNAKRNINNDSIFIELDSIFEPKSFDVSASGDSTFYRSKIFFAPGDTLSFEIEDRKIRFKGTNAGYNNFYIALEEKTTDYRNNPYKGNINDYKVRTKNIYTQKLNFFDEYSKQNNLTNDIYTNLIKDMLKFEYLNNLISPRSVFVEEMNWFVNTQEGVLSAMNNENLKQEELFDFNDYLDNTTIKDYQRPDLLKNSWAFKNSFDAFIRYYFANKDYLNFSREAFLAQKDFIQQNFDGDLEYYAIARMIREYNIRGFGFSTENIVVLKNIIAEYDSIFSKRPSYKKEMDGILLSINNFNFKLSEDALQSKLLSAKGDTITLLEVFNGANNKIKVIDFWASWCPPCISEIKKVKSFKNELTTSEKVEWIYLSIDKDKSAWLKRSKELSEFLNVNHQYLLIGGKNSSLGHELGVSGIPRYVFFNKDDKIILDNGPRPSDTLIFKKVIDKINLDTK
jgi:thiol-disulfide isomerase/thioredoxin